MNKANPPRATRAPKAVDPATSWHVAAAICAWFLPGLGHWLIGQRSRGMILFVTISALWLGGLAIGGISVIDRGAHKAWFLGQMLLAPSLAVDWYRAEQGPQLPAVRPGDPRPDFVPSYARPSEQGILYTALAGMLNMLAIIDVLYRDTKDVAAVSTTPRSGKPHAEGLSV